jgi:signal transduction histidine kinase
VIPGTSVRIRLYGALAIILGAVFAMLAVDVVAAVAISRGMDDIVANSIRSIELVDDIRWQVNQLTRPPSETQAPVASTVERLEMDIRDYDPLATFENEHQEWLQLRDQLARIMDEARRGDWSNLEAHAQRANSHVEQLVAINIRAAAVVGEQMGSLRRKEVAIDAFAGLTTLLLVLQMGVSHLSSLARERLLVERNVALVLEKNRELETFAARAAHELRAPLNPIRGFSDLIFLESDLPEEVRRRAVRIGAAVTRMSGVIDDMLELATIGRLPPGLASVKEMFFQVIGEFEAELGDSEVSSALGDHRVRCSPSVLGQIVRNLFSNALKYRAPERALRVEVSSRTEGDFVALEVADNGIGMDVEAASHAFEPFYRARTGMPGHGLGLAIVEGYARAAGGAAELVSQVGAGTRVTIRLPRA